MAYKALKSFIGVVNMRKGEERDIEDKTLADNLVKEGFVEDLGEKSKAKSSKSTSKKGGETNVKPDL